MTEKLDHLQSLLRAHAPLLVAYSGGVDSTCLLAVAHRTLGHKVLGVIADSPSLPRKALASALSVAKRLKVRIEVIATRELENSLYVNNPPNRCYFCKAELFSRMNALAAKRRFAAIAYGENADDPADLRPGSRAAAQFAVLAPLKQAGLTKNDVRHLSRIYGLPTADAAGATVFVITHSLRHSGDLRGPLAGRTRGGGDARARLPIFSRSFFAAFRCTRPSRAR